jgi:hypothetical protein
VVRKAPLELLRIIFASKDHKDSWMFAVLQDFIWASTVCVDGRDTDLFDFSTLVNPQMWFSLMHSSPKQF